MAQNGHSNQSFDIKWLGLDEIIPYARNPRRNDRAVAKTADSIQAFGWKQTVGHMDPDAIPEPPPPTTQPGDAAYVWHAGTKSRQPATLAGIYSRDTPT